MQRKNNLLNPSKRSGIALMMAMAVVVIIGTIMALSLSLTTQTAKRTTDIYIHEQVVLISKSAAEYALLQISKNPPCSLKELNTTQDYYHIDIGMKYIYTSDVTCTNGATKYITVITPEQNGSVQLDITVGVPASEGVTNEPIRYFRRVIEKL